MLMRKAIKEILQQKKVKENPIPKFKNYEEEANWFDTHDMADYQDEFKRVHIKVAKNLSEGITVRFDPTAL